MTTKTTLAASACAILTLAGPAFAQDQAAFQLPAQCSDAAAFETAASEAQAPATEHGAEHAMDLGGAVDDGKSGMMSDHDMDHGDDGMMPEHVRQNMEKMLQTMPAMRQGMMQQDADVAFACGMIAHHQAAIDMAKVLLDHGQDAQLRGLAEEIIDLQADEIDVMTEWLATSAR